MERKHRRIFILGNGFDLAHYLPTQYIHFMEAMAVVEDWETKNDIYFDELFCSRLKKKDSFLLNTKKLYKTTQPIIYYEDATALQNKLNKNFWYKHFKNHLSDIVTWIDFESEIEATLFDMVRILKKSFDIDTVLTNDGYNAYLTEDKIFINQNFWGDFGAKGLMYQDIFRNLNVTSPTESPSSGERFDSVDEKYLKTHSSTYLSFNEIEVFGALSDSLEGFKDIFQKYICLVINKLNPKVPFSPFGDLGKEIEAVFTFNYSDSFERFYPESLPTGLEEIQYIHGSAEAKNIVLGVSELNDDLKKYKIFNFVKSYQSIVQKTNYETIIELSRHLQRKPLEKVELLIWGHSLDISDKKYILEIFDSENSVDWESHIWCFGKPHTYLANLMNILGEDSTLKKIMSKKIRLDTPAPDILELNKHII